LDNIGVFNKAYDSVMTNNIVIIINPDILYAADLLPSLMLNKTKIIIITKYRMFVININEFIYYQLFFICILFIIKSLYII